MLFATRQMLHCQLVLDDASLLWLALTDPAAREEGVRRLGRTLVPLT